MLSETSALLTDSVKRYFHFTYFIIIIKKLFKHFDISFSAGLVDRSVLVML